MRLIDADKIESHERMDSFGGQYEPVMVAYMDDIDALPTVDAVPVVRCGECRHFEHCTRLYTKDGFCSDGERKDGEKHE